MIRQISFNVLYKMITYHKAQKINDSENLTIASTLEQDANFKALSSQDKALTRSIIANVFRHKGECDYIINNLLKSKPKNKVIILLYIGIVQLIHIKIDAHAAIYETVNLAKKVSPHHHKLINAILRNIQRSEKTLFNNLNYDKSLLNIPKWLQQELQSYYTQKQIVSLAQEISQNSSKLYLSFKDPHTTIEHQKIINNSIIMANPYSLQIPSPADHQISNISGFNDGSWWIQNYSASLPAYILKLYLEKHHNTLSHNLDVLDACSAPGGKTMQLSAFNFNVTSLEISKTRITKLQQNLQRSKLTAKVINSNIFEYQPKQKFHAILLDAPCSATGTLLKNPEGLYFKSSQHIQKLQQTQYDMILYSLKNLLLNNGIIMFCTCSILESECYDIIYKLQRKINIDIIDINKILNKNDNLNQYISSNGLLKITPSAKIGLDGFLGILIKVK